MYTNQNFKLLRKTFGYKQADIAPLLKLKPSMVSHIERGGTMQEYTKELAATLFGITKQQLEGKLLTMDEAQLLYINATQGVGDGVGSELSVSADNTFKNDISRRFYEFYQERFQQKTLSVQQVGEDLHLGKKSYTYEYWHLLRKGTISVDVTQVYLAHQKHGLDINYVFGTSNASMAVTEPDAVYMVGANNKLDAAHIGKVIDKILTKHKTPRTSYAEHELQITPRTLQRIIKGEINPSFLLVAKIAEDHGESLDMFRVRPLPKGHYLTVIAGQEKRIAELTEMVKLLQKEQS